VREIRTLRAMRRGLETEPRRILNGHRGGNPRHSQGYSYGSPRQFPTLPGQRAAKHPIQTRSQRREERAIGSFGGLCCFQRGCLLFAYF
jgi:hypothetical protein